MSRWVCILRAFISAVVSTNKLDLTSTLGAKVKEMIKEVICVLSRIPLKADQYSEQLKRWTRTYLVPGLVVTGTIVLVSISWERSKLLPATILALFLFVGIAIFVLKTSAQKLATRKDERATPALYLGLGRGEDARPAFERKNEDNSFPARVEGMSHDYEVNRGWIH